MFSLLTSTLASTARRWRGTTAIHRSQQPDQLLELYDMEGCPYCRPVRECLTELDLDALIIPCPKGFGERRDQLSKASGNTQVPFLVDKNTGTSLGGCREITRYLQATYGQGKASTRPLPGDTSSKLSTGFRALRGTRHAPARQPEAPLELFSFESSPFSRPVRETLCAHGIPYVLRNSGKQQKADLGLPWLRPTLNYAPLPGSKRAELLQRAGKVQVPYLFDPNTGKGLFESKDIVEYLSRTYQHR